MQAIPEILADVRSLLERRYGTMTMISIARSLPLTVPSCELVLDVFEPSRWP